MEILNIAALLEALDKGCLQEELQRQLAPEGELLKKNHADSSAQENISLRKSGLSVRDVLRYEFHETGTLHHEDYRLSEEQRRKYVYPVRGEDPYAED